MYHVTQILLSIDFSHCLREPEQDKVVEPTPPCPNTPSSEEPMETDTEPSSSQFVSRKEYIFGRIWQRAKKENVPWDEMSKVDCDAVWIAVQQAS